LYIVFELSCVLANTEEKEKYKRKHIGARRNKYSVWRSIYLLAKEKVQVLAI